DETAMCRMAIWGDVGNELRVQDVVDIKNGETRLFDRRLRLILNRNGGEIRIIERDATYYVELGQPNISERYADSGTLRDYLQEKAESISWDLKLKFASEIASAVSCLHENNIIHRDLNFLVHQKTIKLVDFGLSRKIRESTTTSTFQVAGIVPYIDPQCFKINDNKVYKPNKKSDVYSVGVLLWELSSNRPPFSNLDQVQQRTLHFHISQGIREEPIPNTPDEYVNLPDIQYVETMLGKISGSSVVDIVDEQQKNVDGSSFGHP
ncbi:17671_t:CDS:2, partial [Entrophospora sp. SA101]